MSDIAESVFPGGFRLVEFDEIDGTNAEALRQIACGADAGLVLRADRQTAGRGRRDTAWVSEPGNLFASLVVSLPPAAYPGQLSFVTAVAAGAAVRDVAPDLDGLGFEWPNDVVVGRSKLAGILIEAAVPRIYVVGIGMNLHSAPRGLDRPATCLRKVTGASVSPNEMLAAFCRRLTDWRDRWLRDGFAPVRAAWLEDAVGIGATIEARLPERTLAGVFAGIDDDGALLLDLAGGHRCEITAGAVFFAEPEAATCC